ncbi:MAG: XRE family transcriptional regulator [Deltaproteobacteria bacterium]|nr:MAG: XRE family transcriptional regulator [Deltaproteobacteria bacterium]
MVAIVITPADHYLGQRLRTKRVDQGLSQKLLGSRLGISAQQIEKYENGTTRISASRLLAMAEILSIPVAWFFEGAPRNLDYVPAERTDDVETFLMSPQAFEVVSIWPGLNHRRRQELLLLMRAMDWAPG